MKIIMGFNGERQDPFSGMTHLGGGYRTYNPVLMRFICPDSWSPFDAGGINPYVYCAGDPVNRSDPSGHMSWQAGLGIGLGLLGILGAAFTGGTSIVAAGSLSAALAGASSVSLVVGASALVADVAGIASAAIQDSHPQTAIVLGWVALAAGIVGVGAGGLGRMTRTQGRAGGLLTYGRVASQASDEDMFTASPSAQLASHDDIVYGANHGRRIYTLGMTGSEQANDLAYAYTRPLTRLRSAGEELIVVGHGTPGRFLLKSQYYPGKLRNVLLPTEFYQMLAARVPDLSQFRKITLGICFSADGCNSLLEAVLENVNSGVQVTGYTGIVKGGYAINWSAECNGRVFGTDFFGLTKYIGGCVAPDALDHEIQMLNHRISDSGINPFFRTWSVAGNNPVTFEA